MTRKNDCIANVADASGVTRQEAADALTEAMDEADRLKAAGYSDNVQGRVTDIMTRKAEEAKIAAAMRRRHAGLNAIARDRLDAQLDSYIAQGLQPAAAMEVVFEGTQRAIRSGRASVSNKAKALERKYWGMVEQQLVTRKDVRKLMEKRDKTFMTNTRKEWYELRKGGRPGATGDEPARFAAKMFADVTEAMRLEMNRLGANIGKLDGWTGAQSHDPVKMVKVTQQEWVDTVKPLLDLDRMFGAQGPDKIDEVLGEVYLTLATGRDGKIDGAMRGDFKGPPNLAKSMGSERVLHFKSPELSEQYNDMFGSGDIIQAVFGSIETAGRTAALMETFGPNPRVMLDSVLSKRQLAARNDPKLTEAQRQKAVARLNASNFDIYYDIASGGFNQAAAGREGVAQIAQGARNIQAMAKLGGAALTAMPTDTITMIAAQMNRGNGLVKSTASTIGALFGNMSGSERKLAASVYGEGMDAVIGNLTRGFAGNDGPVGALSSLTQRYFRWNGLAPWTDAARTATASMVAREAGERAGMAFDALPERYRWVLEGHDITPERWDKLRATTTEMNGGRYVDIGKIDDRELEMAWRRLIADETNYGVVEMDYKSRRWAALSINSRAGTLSGEIIRSIMQFKGFPMAFTERIFGRAVMGGRGATTGERLMRQTPHLGVLLGGLTAAGYVSMTMKDTARGAWPPRDFADTETIIAALTQGGALGIYGDFLFTDSSNTRNSFLETVAGPGLGTLAQVLNAVARTRDGEGRWSDAVNIGVGLTPGANLFYTRAATDYLFVNALRDEASPGYLKRRERYRKEDYGQELLFNERLF